MSIQTTPAQKPPPPSLGQSESIGPHAGVLILVVDDNAAALKATVRILTKAGYEVAQAANGAEALRQIRTLRPALVLLDVVLPDISGVEVLGQVRLDLELELVSVVLLSSQQIESEHQVTGLDAGADGYIVRPVGNQELLARVRSQLRQHELTKQLNTSKIRFRNLIVCQQDAVLVVDREGLIQFANPAAETLFGRALGELIGSPCGFPIEDGDTQEVTLHHSDGSITITEVRVGVSEWDGQHAWIATLRDITERRAHDAKLKLLAAIVESSEDAIFSKDLNDIITSWNQGAERVFGYTSDEILGTSIARLIPADRRDEERQINEKFGRGEYIDRFETVRQSKSGLLLDVSLATSPINDIHGNVIGMSKVVRNVTERKRLEREMELLGSAVNNVNESIVITSADLARPGPTIVFANPAFTETTGYESQEVIGRSPRLLQGPKTNRAVLNRLKKTLAAGEPFFGETVNYRKDRSEYLVEWHIAPIRNSQGEVTHFVSIQRDITARKAAEEALKISEQRFRQLADAMPQIVWAAAADGNTDYSNQRWMEYTGMTLEQTQGWGLGTAVHPDDLQQTIDSWKLAINTKVPFEMECRFRRASDGVWRWHLVRALPVKDHNGAIARWFGTCTDIDDQKRANDEIRALNEDLEKRVTVRTEQLDEARREAEFANHAKSEFLSRMSHELRTPLNAILGFGQLLEFDELATDQKRAVQLILKGGRHLLSLINEVLDMARIESGKLQFSAEPILMREAVHGTLDLVRPLAAQRNIKLELESIEEWENSYVRVDRQRIIQVLLNLLSNAIKYNREAGTVAVTGKKLSETQFRLSVRDTGPGICDQKIRRLFVPFDRLDADQTRVEGTGLGLALSRGLITAMGGSIGVDSVVGEGSVFWLELPLANPVSSKDGLALEVETVTHFGESEARTVLYIEDNLSNLELMERILERRPGTRLLSAIQGSLGLELAREHRPDLILLDLHLPDIGGHEVLLRLKAEETLRTVPVVIISADATQTEISRLMLAGAHAYLTKPFEVQRLIEILNETLGASKNKQLD